MKLLAIISNQLGLALLKLLSILPRSANHAIGDALGWIAHHVPSERKKVVDTNLQLCFPDLNPLALRQLALQHWQLFGRSVTERAYLWLGSRSTIEKMVQVRADINVKDGKNRLFISMHLMGIEAGLIRLSCYLDDQGVQHPITLYVKMKNTFFDQKIKTWRERFGAKMMLRQHHSRELIRLIRANHIVAISPDMDLGLQDSVFVPFFGVPACTVTSISRLALLSKAEVCPVITTLNADGKSYTAHIQKALEHFPSNDAVADTLRLNQFFEAQIIGRPQEYYWVHKRFKNRPSGQAKFY